MQGVGLLGMVLAGVAAGSVARALVRQRLSLFMSLMLGLAGAALGALTAQALDLRFQGLLALFVLATAGATAILAVAVLLTRHR